MKSILFFLLIVSCSAFSLNTQAKKKKKIDSTVNNAVVSQVKPINYRYWDKQIENHRGYNGFPENTLIGLEEAIMQGFQIVECDVAFSKDGVPILSHDPKIDRCSMAKGLTTDYTIQELSQIDFGYKTNPKYEGTSITTLREALMLCRRNNAIIELDCANKKRFPNDKYEAVYNLVKKCGMLESTIFCDDAENLKVLLDIDPNVIVSISHCISLKDVEKGLDIAKRARFADFSFRHTLITQPLIDYIHGQGFYVKIWTVDELNDMKRFVAMGVDHILSNKLNPKFDYRIIEIKPKD
mgnify:CR=1 FL=1